MNLYEILEVSETASLETINKIYKIQAKKYHPDLQTTEEGKRIAEEKMKKINEAYNVLSDEDKRKNYDNMLKEQREQQKRIEQEKIINSVSNISSQNQTQNNSQVHNVSQVQNVQNNGKVYTKEDYIRDYNKRLRQYKYQMKLDNLKKNVQAILIVIIILVVIWFFPPTHKMIVDLYEDNIVLQTLVAGIKNMFINMKTNM